MNAVRTRTLCAWCRKVQYEGQPGDVVSHGLCATCARTYQTADVESLLDLTADQLDRLPLGFVGLDRERRVTSYNTAEQQLSGLSPEDVVGKNFFTSASAADSARVSASAASRVTSQ